MSNPKGGGMASKERLYELWMLYYTKVRASAEDLPVTPVVAAGPTVWTLQILAGTHTVAFCGVYFKIDEEGGGLLGFYIRPAVYLPGGGASVWRSASWLIISTSEQLKFATVINNNLSGAG